MGASCVRWTADTERAFLLALRLTRQVTQAAAQIGRAPGVCYDRRRRVPAFAAAWEVRQEILRRVRAIRAQESSAKPPGDAPD